MICCSFFLLISIHFPIHFSYILIVVACAELLSHPTIMIQAIERQAALSKLTAEYQTRESLNKSIALEPTDEDLEKQVQHLVELNGGV